jgi:hypothetical protein
MTRTGRTIGAAVGAVVFVLFFADLAGRFVHPLSAAEPVSHVTLKAR